MLLLFFFFLFSIPKQKAINLFYKKCLHLYLECYEEPVLFLKPYPVATASVVRCDCQAAAFSAPRRSATPRGRLPPLPPRRGGSGVPAPPGRRWDLFWQEIWGGEKWSLLKKFVVVRCLWWVRYDVDWNRFFPKEIWLACTHYFKDHRDRQRNMLFISWAYRILCAVFLAHLDSYMHNLNWIFELL